MQSLDAYLEETQKGGQTYRQQIHRAVYRVVLQLKTSQENSHPQALCKVSSAQEKNILFQLYN